MTEVEPNIIIREYVENDGARGWAHKQMAQNLYEWADVFKYYFLSPQNESQPVIPNLLVAVASLRMDTLAAYRLTENPNGLPYEIIMNSMYLNRPLWEILETELHEMAHLFQENTPGYRKCVNGYHNAEFVEICESLGLHPRPGSGAHWKPADGQFGRLMERYGIPKPDYAEEAEVPPGKKKEYWWDRDRGGRRGSSTLLKYICKCEPPKNSVRTGRRDLTALCLACGDVFKPEMVANQIAVQSK